MKITRKWKDVPLWAEIVYRLAEGWDRCFSAMMTELTDEVVQEEVTKIRTLRWPMGNILPLKHLWRDRFNGDGLGYLCRMEDGYIFPCVFLGCVFLMVGDGQMPPTERYDTLEELVRAGWVGD